VNSLRSMRLAVQEPSATSLLIAREERAMFAGAWDRLSNVDHAFMDMLYVQQVAPEDIASALNISINTVYSRSSKIRSKLAALIDQQQSPGSNRRAHERRTARSMRMLPRVNESTHSAPVAP